MWSLASPFSVACWSDRSLGLPLPQFRCFARTRDHLRRSASGRLVSFTKGVKRSVVADRTPLTNEHAHESEGYPHGKNAEDEHQGKDYRHTKHRNDSPGKWGSGISIATIL